MLFLYGFFFQIFVVSGKLNLSFLANGNDATSSFTHLPSSVVTGNNLLTIDGGNVKKEDDFPFAKIFNFNK